MRQNIVSFAEKFVGVPYKYGAKDGDAPDYFDCSGFVQYVYKKFGYEIPRSTILQAEFIKKSVGGMRNLKGGDLIFMHGERGYYTKKFPQGIGHVVIYMGDGKVVHASGLGRKRGVVIENLKKVVANRRPLVVIKRII